MDIYQGWADLKDGVSDMDFARAFETYMSFLKSEGAIEGWRLMRRKLGLSPDGMGEFHFLIEVRDLAQLDQAFGMAASRSGDTEVHHHGLNSLVTNARFALYRDFPDAARKEGEERF